MYYNFLINIINNWQDLLLYFSELSFYFFNQPFEFTFDQMKDIKENT